MGSEPSHQSLCQQNGFGDQWWEEEGVRTLVSMWQQCICDSVVCAALSQMSPLLASVPTGVGSQQSSQHAGRCTLISFLGTKRKQFPIQSDRSPLTPPPPP